MDSDLSSVWHYLRLNNWGQPYVAQRRVKVTTYSQEIQKFSVHVEMYCISYEQAQQTSAIFINTITQSEFSYLPVAM